MIINKIVEILRGLRFKLSVSTKDIYKAMDISPSTMIKLENGIELIDFDRF